MADTNWGTPSILKLLVTMQKLAQMRKKEELEQQLTTAKSMLDSQLVLLKKQNNG